MGPITEAGCFTSDALGDVGGDGRSDVVFRNSNGDVTLWQMNGSNVQANFLGIVGSAISTATANATSCGAIQTAPSRLGS